jgi:hypothetical protein
MISLKNEESNLFYVDDLPFVIDYFRSAEDKELLIDQHEPFVLVHDIDECWLL